MIEAYHIEPTEARETIVGQGNFSLKTVDDLARALIATASGIKVGVAMNDGGMSITRTSGNDPVLEKDAGRICHDLGAGHAFVCLVEKAFPINLLNDLSHVHGVVTIFAATANPLDVLVYKTGLGKAVIGVVDGKAPTAIEEEPDKQRRKETLKKFGYHLG
ncbi:MAG: adenosine monophosphate-protein transferase [Candidatus Diapherotrites archaeon]|nr:adenosine monophosphate-protein transferase [Candidatus Diapherotrites archaeon]